MIRELKQIINNLCDETIKRSTDEIIIMTITIITMIMK